MLDARQMQKQKQRNSMMLLVNKVERKMKCMQKDKEDQILNGGDLHSREDKILNMYVPNDIVTKYKGQQVLKMK